MRFHRRALTAAARAAHRPAVIKPLAHTLAAIRPAALALAFALALLPAAPASAQEPEGAGEITEEQRRELERISTLGYMAAGEPAPDVSGVTVNSPEAWPGYTIYVSGDYTGAFLIDMDGEVVHTWYDPRTSVNQSKEWTRVLVKPDGTALGVTRYPAQLRKLTWDSELVWNYGSLENRVHHDVTLGPDGRVYVLTSRAENLPWLSDEPILEEFVCVLEDEGASFAEIDCVPLSEAFRVSAFVDTLRAPWFGQDGDAFHTNSVEVLDGRVPHVAFGPGNILLSIRNMDCLAVLDPGAREIVWLNRGRWQRQHEARVTPEGHVMLFDNRKFEGQSRIVEYDVVTEEIVWSYTAEDFFTGGTGAQQLLPNGNVLITESEPGRLLEVTREGEIVWEYWNPRRLNGGRTMERITRAFRVPYDYFEGELSEHLAGRRGAGRGPQRP